MLKQDIRVKFCSATECINCLTGSGGDTRQGNLDMAQRLTATAVTATTPIPVVSAKMWMTAWFAHQVAKLAHYTR
jgi:hypothetical protein